MAKKKTAKKTAKKPLKKKSSAKKSSGKAPAKKRPAKAPKKAAAKKKTPKATAKKPVKKTAAKKGTKKTLKKTTAKKTKPGGKKAPAKAAKKKATTAKPAARKKTTKKRVSKGSAPAKAVAARKPDSRGSGATGAPSKPTPARSRKQYIPDIDRPTGMYGGVMLTDAPKPFPKTSPYSKSELKALKEALLAEQSRLRRELASLEELAMGGRDRSEEAARFPSESSEYSAEMQAAETIMGVRTLEEERLEQVNEALERIDAKRNYGLCLACGNKIGIERLIAKPHAHLCMDCRRTFERKRMQEGY